MSEINIEQILSAKKAIYSKLINLLEQNKKHNISGGYKSLGEITITSNSNNNFEKKILSRLDKINSHGSISLREAMNNSFERQRK
mgnify:CR=1 FL=1|jgi:hypothetical protein